VASAVPGGSSQTSSKNKASSTNDHNDNGPSGQGVGNNQSSLLRSVGEVVVAGGHVVKGRGGVHADHSKIEVGFSSVHLHAVLHILFHAVLVVSVLGGQFLIGQANWGILLLLVQIGSSFAHLDIREHVGVAVQPVRGSGMVAAGAFGLDDVAAIGLISAFSSVTSGVLVATGPLEVDVVRSVDGQLVRDEVIFSGRVGLDDVAALALDIQVVDLASQ